MLLESLLLVATLAPESPSTIGSLFKEILPYAALIYSFYNNYRAKNNEESRKLQDSIKHLESVCNNHTILHTSHQQERERLVDVNNQWKLTIEARLNNVDNLVNEVQSLKIRMESQNQQITAIKDKLTELSTTVKESNKEILDMVKKLYAK